MNKIFRKENKSLGGGVLFVHLYVYLFQQGVARLSLEFKTESKKVKGEETKEGKKEGREERQDTINS